MSGELCCAIDGGDRNSTTATPSLKTGGVPVVGYPGPIFAAIHVSALVVLSLSTVVSTALMVFLCGCCRCCCYRSAKSPNDYTTNGQHRNGKPSQNGVQITAGEANTSDPLTRRNVAGGVTSALEPPMNKRRSLGVADSKGKHPSKDKQNIRSFWKWNVGERFVLYIAISDMSLGISHFFDHAYMFYTGSNPPDLFCSFFAFLLHEFSLAQWLAVAASAVSACGLVVFGRKFSFGRWDWRLLVFAFLSPCVVGSVGLKYQMLGATGAWCYVSLGTEAGKRYHQVLTVFQVTLYGIISLAYGAIWVKIQRTARLMNQPSTNRYHSSAAVMLIFVGVFMFQWSPFTVYSVWFLLHGQPPAPFFIISAIVVNLGGVYNCFAYTIVRRRLQKSGCKRWVVSGGEQMADAVQGHPTISVSSRRTDINTTASDNNGDLGYVCSSASNTNSNSESVRFEIYI